MNYGDFKTRVLMLINQHTIAGNEIALSYNNQYDYIAKIPSLLDSVQRYLATTTRPIYAEFPLNWDKAEQKEGFYIFQMPDDFWQLIGRGLPVMRAGEFTMYHRYKWMGRDKLVIPVQDKADMTVHYYRYPASVPAKPEDDYKLDNHPDAQEAAAYYVAANLVMHDNAFAYSALYNEYESRRQQMYERPQAEYARIEEMYGNPGDGFYGV